MDQSYLADLISTIIYWSEAYRPALWWLGVSSIVLFLAFLIGIPLIIIKLPTDYFRRIGLPMAQKRPLTRKHVIGLIIKHIVGLIFLVAGIIMLVLPGQGLLSIMIGLSLVYFPGKRRLILSIVWPTACLEDPKPHQVEV